MTIKCIVCVKEFKTKLSILRKGAGKFCSRKCMAIWKSKNETGSNNHHWKGGKVKTICVDCGKEFFIDSAKIKYGSGKFCSRECNRHFRSINDRGDRNPCWRGGVTPISLRIRNSKEYSKWRHQIFQRDNFSCVKCGGNKSGSLVAHHKKPFSVIVQEVRNKMPLLSLYDAAMAFAKMWDTNNGVTLCEDCHIKVHTNRKNLVEIKGLR